MDLAPALDSLRVPRVRSVSRGSSRGGSSSRPVSRGPSPQPPRQSVDDQFPLAPQAADRNKRVRLECPECGYKSIPQWLNDKAHCLKCQAVLMVQPTVHQAVYEHHADFARGSERRMPGEVSTFKQAPGSAMESSLGVCTQSPDRVHHWKYGKCNFCQKPEGKLLKRAGVMANPGGDGGCGAGGKCAFKFAKCSKCGRKEF